MKKSFLIIGLTLFIAIPAIAELTIDDTVSPGYLKNHGHSDATIWAVQKSIATTNGEELEEPVNELYERPVIKQIRKVFMYFDPALDSHTFMNNHNINSTTRYDDL